MTSDAEFIPSPSQIAEACREIRKGWSAKTLRRRKVKEAIGWLVPTAGRRSIREARREMLTRGR